MDIWGVYLILICGVRRRGGIRGWGCSFVRRIGLVVACFFEGCYYYLLSRNWFYSSGEYSIVNMLII